MVTVEVDPVCVESRLVTGGIGTVSVSSSPSGRDPAAPGWVRSNSLARASSATLTSKRGVGVLSVGHPAA